MAHCLFKCLLISAIGKQFDRNLMPQWKTMNNHCFLRLMNNNVYKGQCCFLKPRFLTNINSEEESKEAERNEER